MKQFIFFCLSLLLMFARLEAIPPDIVHVKHKTQVEHIEIVSQEITSFCVAEIPQPTANFHLQAIFPIDSSQNPLSQRCAYLHEPLYDMCLSEKSIKAISFFDRKTSCYYYEDFIQDISLFLAEVSTKSRPCNTFLG
jgi:hypothetical protein